MILAFESELELSVAQFGESSRSGSRDHAADERSGRVSEATMQRAQ